MVKNKPYTVTTEDGKEKVIYDGRYTCVCGVVFAKEENTLYVLANKRGEGCPTNVGLWNMPCGYVDAGSIEENVSREVYEETGIKISPDDFVFMGLSDTSKERNITLRYVAVLNEGRQELPSLEQIKTLGGEENEVAETKWIDIRFLDKYKWAFNHDNVITSILMEIYEFQKELAKKV